MDNEKRSDIPQEENWLDDILEPQEFNEELGPDEHAISSAGLTHPADAQLEQIMEETNSAGWQEVPEAMEDSPAEEELEAEAPAAVEGGEPDPDSESYDEGYAEEAPAEDPVYFEEPAPQEQVYVDEPEVYGEEPEVNDEEPEEAPAAPARKRRPHRKKGYGLFGIPHLIATVIWLLIILAIGVSLGRMIWVCAADMLAFGREDQEVVFTITSTDDLDTIAENLKEAGLIRYPELFKMFVDLKDAEEEISSGTFKLNTLYDYNALVNSLSPYAEGREIVEVVIPEGYTCAQIFSLLEENNVCTVAELEEYAANGELSEYWFLEGVERGDKYCLEGYLFPDTYEFYTNDDPQNALEKLLDGFDSRFTDKMKENLIAMNDKYCQMMAEKGYSEEYIASHQLTIREIVIIASMVEKETAGASDSYRIAAVIYNRLTNPEYLYLNIDATIVYALGGKTDPLTLEDLQLDSPYNTYIYEGLPAGPISNPGRQSLYAALEPYPDTMEADYYSFYYYAYDPEAGEHHYSTTYEEHEAFLATIESYD